MEETEKMLYALAMSREGEEGREDRRNAKTKVICKPLLHRNSFPIPCFCVCQFVLIKIQSQMVLSKPSEPPSPSRSCPSVQRILIIFVRRCPSQTAALTFCHSGVLILRVHSAQTLQDVSPKNILSCDHKNQPSPEM